MEDKLQAFNRLLRIMDELREKCPWDKKQTMESLRHLTIEETYELTDAVLEKDMDKIKKELGDILLHIVFYARIASENNSFTIADVINTLCDKLIHRHPHIYGNLQIDHEDEVKRNWEKLKLKEGNTSVLGGVPGSLPALVKAFRIQEKARAVGFDWEDPQEVMEKVQEELAELKQELQHPEKNEKVQEEFGDLLFSLINFARFIGVNPEDALEKTNKKFIQRFQYLESKAKKNGKQLNEMSLQEMDHYWKEAKEHYLPDK
jgi:XTP/dITP diphosphohydrolase